MKIKNNNSGFSLVELVVALAVFAILAAGVFYVVTNSYTNFYGAGDKQALAEYAQEGVEAVRAIRSNSWQNIEDGIGSNGLTKGSNGLWTFSGSSDTQGALTRVVAIANASRDVNWNIVDAGGTEDPSTKKVTVTVSADGVGDYVLYTYLTDWNYKTWEQTDWSGSGDREFWADNTMASSSFSNISTSTGGEVSLARAQIGTQFSWSAWADLVPDSTAKYKAWEDFYNYQLGADGKSLYIIGTTNYDFTKYDISRAAAGIFSPEFKIAVPWHTQNVVLNPVYTNYAYIARRLPADGTDNICVVKLDATSVDTTNDCYDVTYAGASNYYHEMLVNQAGTKLYVLDTYGYGYTFTISNSGATLTLTNDMQLISSGAGSGYAINSAYLDESGAQPYVYLASDDPSGEFRKMGFDGDFFSSTSTDAYVDSSYVYDFTDIEFLETSSGKNRFIIGTEDSSKEFMIVEDQGSSLTEVGSYNLATSQSYAEVTHDGANMAFVHYYNPGGLYAIDITDRANPADGSLSNTSMDRKSNYTTFDQLKFATSSGGMFVHNHVASDNTTELYFIGRSMTRASGGQYTYKRKITLGQNSKVSGGPHTDFPIAISEAQDYLKTVANGGKVENDNGYDIIFTSDSAGATVLSHEIEYYNPSTGEMTAWVKVPTLAANTDIYMFYGNSDIVSTQENISDVWSNNYQMVTHLNDSGIGGVRSSVTSSGGWFKYASSSPSESTGIIGRGQYFDEEYDYLTIENNTDKAQGTSDFTVEFWMKPDSTAADTYASPVYFGNGGVNGQDGWLFRTYLSTKKLYFHMGYNNVANLGGFYLRDTAITDDIWTYVAVTVDRDVGYQGYLDTSAVNSFSSSTEGLDIGHVYDVTIGKDWSSSNYFFKGEVDELRISTDLKSTDWMTTGYNNIYSTSTFYTVYSEEQALGYAASGSIYSSIYNIGSSDQDLRSITVEQNIPSGCILQVTLEGADNAAMSGASSQVFDDSSTTLYTSSTPVALDGKNYLRYKVGMTNCNSNLSTPTLYSVKLNYR
jgi:prepilin-type N-terminal cleavage/methylation domain-containing protein